MSSSHTTLAVYHGFSFTQRRRILLLGLFASTCLGVQAFAVEGYNINDGQELSNTAKQPYTDLSRANSADATIAENSIAPLPKKNVQSSSIDDGDKQSLAQVSTPSSDVGFIQPISSVALPNKPLYPSRSEQPSLPTVSALNSAAQSSNFTVESKPTHIVKTAPHIAAVPVASSQSSPPDSAHAVKITAPAPLTLPPVTDAVKAQAEKELAANPLLSDKEPLQNLSKNANSDVTSNPKPLPLPIPNTELTSSASHIALPPPPPALLARQEQDPSSLAPQSIPDVSSAASVSKSALAQKNPSQLLTVGKPPEVLGTIESGLTTPSQNATRTALTQDSRQILGSLQPEHVVTANTKSGRVDVKRINPDVSDIIKKATQVYESAGVSLKVSPVQSDPTIELSRAYETLMAGDNASAIQIYQSILRNNPTNEEALFGLAATYHRTGQLENARSLYGRLLAQNPSHREGLNNFLVLAANEAPEETLEELAKLELRNPDFSPIPAQMGIILDRLGKPELARNKMIRAIQLAPENWAYKYNLAVMLDRQGYYADAAQLYKDLITASLRGEKIPGNQAALQDRLNYIAARADGKNAG